MAHVEGHGKMDTFARFNKSDDGFQHWKYPETVGADTAYDDINFNSNATSEYAIERMSTISETTHEPFMMFEIMKVSSKTEEYENELLQAEKSYVNAALARSDFLNAGLDVDPDILDATIASAKSKAEDSMREIVEFSDFGRSAKRHYTGSICLYMPTDIQINDTMVYTEDTRKFGALLEEVRDEGVGSVYSSLDSSQTVNTATIASTITGLAALIGGKGSALLGGLAGFGIGDIYSAETQRTLGRKGNPNEYAAYTNTPLRTFTFAWTILPDSLNESKQAAGLIKFFRMSAHAKKNSSTKITVPDQVITSFHGAKDMIQLPPTFIEAVSVTYNPNQSSFFRRNNAPVEIGLSVTLKEIVPLYTDDVKRGL